MDIVFRAVFLFAFVFLVMRVIGRRELSSLTPFDLILLIVLGDAIQQALTQDDYSVTGALIVVSTLAVLQVLTSYLGFRFEKLRPLLEGDPIVIVQDGKPVEKNLRRERLAVDEVLEEARTQAQISSLDEIEWAILETSGNISFVKKNSS
jgi:uncharacterized membrane protein YcaP (DUF421 family)